jgi:acetoin utilization deacetylase AcuC-like enzyme
MAKTLCDWLYEAMTVAGMSDSFFPVYFSPHHRRHAPPDSFEEAARIDYLLKAIQDAGIAPLEADDFGLEAIEAVHSEGLLALLQTAFEDFAILKAGPRPAKPDSFAVRRWPVHVPRNIWGRLGYYCSDDLTPILEHTWKAAYGAAQTALSAARAIVQGAPIAYGLCRPPGHHAYRDLYGGYCYLNNAAIAAQWLVSRGRRPAILDLDYHHGDGTQDVFYDRSDVYFCSVHADPKDEYPYYCGYETEQGSGEGEGYTLNLPLPLGTEETSYLRALEIGLIAIDEFAPDVLVVSLGFDSLAGDPEGDFRLETKSFESIGRQLRQINRPLLLIQEGGYRLPALQPALAALLNGLLNDL